MNKSKVTFLKAHTPQEKLKILQETAQTLFLSGKRFTLLAPNEEAVKYLDNFLWNTPPESFLPHQVTTKPTEEIVVITTLQENFNRSVACINVSAKPVVADFAEVYELLDYTSPAKAEQSELKINSYTKRHESTIR